MSNYKHLKETYGQLPAEERMKILHHEILRPISFVRGYANLLSEIIESNKSILPKEAEEHMNKITQAGDDILDIINALALVE